MYNIKNIEAKIASILNLSNEEVERLFPEVSKTSMQSELDIYKKAGYKTTDMMESQAMKDYLKAAIKTTKGDIGNITQSMGFAETQNGHVVYNNIGKFYQKELNLAHLKVKSGAIDYNTAIKQAVKKIADSGVRYVNYESGYSNNLDVAVRRAVLSSVHTMNQQMTDHYMKQILGEDTQKFVEVTYHAGARPSHWWGGMVFKDDR